MSNADTMQVTRWWFIRHAPVVDAPLGKLSGQADIAADVSDRASFQTLAAKLPKEAVWITTHLQRTRQTAEALFAAGAERVEPMIDAAFAEQAFGAWTGLTWADISAMDDPLTKIFWDAPDVTAPPPSSKFTSESAADVCVRVAARMEELTAEHPGRDIVCVAHAGAIRAAMALALGLTANQSLSLDVKNTSLTRLDHISDGGVRVKRGGSWRVVGLNMI